MIRVLSFFLWFYLQLVHRTSSFRWLNKEHDDAARASGKPYIFAFWHHCQAFLLFPFGERHFAVLISPSKDGEIVAQLSHLFGSYSIRGSSRKSPARALLKLLHEIQKGNILAVTPDGPLGPAREVKQGALYLAQASGAPILPVAATSSRKKIFASWDRFQLPLPFGRMAVSFAKPIYVKEGDSLEDKARELKESLDRITEEVNAAVHDPL